MGRSKTDWAKKFALKELHVIDRCCLLLLFASNRFADCCGGTLFRTLFLLAMFITFSLNSFVVRNFSRMGERAARYINHPVE